MKDSAKNAVRTLFDVISAHGVTDVVCSPGSRNAPLVIAANCRKHLKKHIIVDERTAAFAALGISLSSGHPVALICTSGTALLNYAPAVAEAYYQGVPLIVISADRPKEWIDQDDSQTIRQFEALRNFVKESYDISDREVCDGNGWYENRIFNDAMLTALGAHSGPVHINLRLSTPLEALIDHDTSSSTHPRIIRQLHNYPMPSKYEMKDFASLLRGKKIMLVAGFMMPDNRLNKGVLRMSRHENVTIMAETISNLHLPLESYSIDNALCTMSQEERDILAPDIIISIGGALVSRMLKSYLRKCGEKNPGLRHWSIGTRHTTVDCFQCLSLRIDADPGLFLNTLSVEMAHLDRISGLPDHKPGYLTGEVQRHVKDACISSGEYSRKWRKIKISGMERINSFKKSTPLTDLSAFAEIYHHIPRNADLFLSNGTAIRYDQIVSHEIPHATFCNRGVSGIEGCTSTALGIAMDNSKNSNSPVWLITGDTSFSHDLGALAANVTQEAPLKIIVINNAGGAIFRFISSTSRLDCLEEYFCANPGLDIKKMAEAFRFRYFIANNIDELRTALESFATAPEASILEIMTEPSESNRILTEALHTS